MRKTAILFLFLLAFGGAYAQRCDTVDVKNAENLAKEYQKSKERLWAKKDIGITDADKIYDIATYLRQKNDTSNKTWYKWALERFNDEFKTDHNDKGGDHKKGSLHLYRMGMCYFYLEQYNEAVTFLSKAIMAKHNNPCAYYYISFIKKKQGKDTEAEEEFKKFEELTKPGAPDQEKQD